MPGYLTHVATIMVAVIVTVVVVVGGVVTILGNMTFMEYLDALVKAGASAGALAVGRGVMAGLKGRAG